MINTLFRKYRVSAAVRDVLLYASLSAGLLISLTGCGRSPDARAQEQKHASQTRRGNASAGPASSASLSDASSTHSVATRDKSGKGSDIKANSLLPFYPNSSLYQDPGNPSAATQSPDSSSSTSHIVMLETTDPVSAVIDFYDQKLARTEPDPNHPGRQITHFPSRTERKQDGIKVVTLTDTRSNGVLYAVEARRDAGKTLIELMDIAGQHDIPGSIPSGAPQSTATTGKPASKTGKPGAPGAPNNANDDSDPLKPTVLLPGDSDTAGAGPNGPGG